MTHPVIAIGLDAADPKIIEEWMSQGHLKNLRRLRDEGAYGRLRTFDYYRAETPWTTFLTGRSPQETGYWAPLKLKEGTYEVENVQSHDFAEHQPFYALGDDYRVAVFDMPQAPLASGVNGVQALAWGAHSPQTPTHSKPEFFLQETIEKHGEHPTLLKDFACVMDVKALEELKENMKVGIARRGEICKDLLEGEDWDFFLTIFGETHSAGHVFWHLSQPNHPLYPLFADRGSGDPMLETFEAIDEAIGEIVSEAPENARVAVFAAHGMDFNNMDLPSMVFLPEFMFRLNFPGKYGLARANVNEPPGPPVTKGRAKRGWMGTVWSMKHEQNPVKGFLRRQLPRKVFEVIEPIFGTSEEMELVSPFEMRENSNPLYYQSAAWYQPFWPQMKAFALPSFSEGYIRINLKGREPHGIVDPADYHAVCDETIAKLSQMVDARTGEPMVKDIIRTRENPTDSDPKLPDADLVVIWQDKSATDVVESPDIGRIGPVPFNRTGSHRSDGFMVAKGPGIEADSTIPAGHSLDLAPTMLHLLDAPIPPDFEGQPMLKIQTSAVVG
ncbi:alkaline phosphatase family protein [Phormidium sp. CCY1219]|uniref:alkaline phosphatase family protein n=1 Tax=Phormidium sp. CCY1219 TaxID=2886104 RepID=UPI002D1E665D|nr:alkaline phosphatase family protein [Phormidium sp. CCY1219]MEB3830224.1 alkaline phosphatase family protein [Phormidium sp. CCY1219]